MDKNSSNMDFCTKKKLKIKDSELSTKSDTEDLDFLSGFTQASRQDEDTSWRGRRFDEWNLIYVNSGELEIFPEKSQACIIKTGSMVLVAPGYVRTYRRNSKTSLLFFHFKMNGHIDSTVKWKVLQAGFFIYTPDCKSRRRCLAALQEAHTLAIHRQRGWYNLAYSLVSTVIHRGNAEALSELDNKALEEAAKVLANLSLAPDMNEVARLCGFSRTLFYVKFRQYFGVSPRAYRENHVFRKAQTMLENTDYSLERIASEIGLNDPFYFSRRFRILYGLSPSEYRKRLKKA